VDLVRLERAVIGYRVPLLPPLDLGVKAGSTLGVLGPNGAGKTALLKSLLGRRAPAASAGTGTARRLRAAA